MRKVSVLGEKHGRNEAEILHIRLKNESKKMEQGTVGVDSNDVDSSPLATHIRIVRRMSRLRKNVRCFNMN